MNLHYTTGRTAGVGSAERSAFFVDHALVGYSFASIVWATITRWCNIHVSSLGSVKEVLKAIRVSWTIKEEDGNTFTGGASKLTKLKQQSTTDLVRFKHDAKISIEGRWPESKKKEENAVWGSRDTFVDVVKGGTRVHKQHEGLVMELTQTELVKLEELIHFLMIKVKDVNHMENLYFLFQHEGFFNFDICYMCGFWVRIDFLNAQDQTNFKESEAMKFFFSDIKHVSQNFTIKERITWVEICGLPP
ncbi:hypothetical protein L1987_02012 [Smallanthus sonchifolius]|uniref:Uncharacterized protein n=1 Tax=Smallanthus sonchifolius TaxID=185202 RepID=A0ACB9K6Q6_9ASTR|nr:hypothetical protein L1987_02012 [Smallanthus sonchifolius]